MKYQISCPFCGRKMIKAEFCSKVEVQCNHCHETIEVSIRKGRVVLESPNIVKCEDDQEKK